MRTNKPPTKTNYNNCIINRAIGLLGRLGTFSRFSIVLFSILNSIIYNKFTTPLGCSSCYVVIASGNFSTLFTTGHVTTSIHRGTHARPLQLTKLVNGHASGQSLVSGCIRRIPVPMLRVLPLVRSVHVSHIGNGAIFRVTRASPTLRPIYRCCLGVTSRVLTHPRNIIPARAPSHSLFDLLSSFCLGPPTNTPGRSIRRVSLVVI